MNNGDVKILVVDDEPGLRDLLRYELVRKGYNVSMACDGEEAIEKAKKEKFHIVISDIKMPKVDGLAVLEAIKELDADVEVIMTTGFGTAETADEAMKKGAYDFIQKPYIMDQLYTAMDQALKKRGLRA